MLSRSKFMTSMAVLAFTLSVILMAEFTPQRADASPASTGDYMLLKALNSGYCLATSANGEDYTPMLQAPCSEAATNQQWRFTFVQFPGNYSGLHIVNRATGKCLTVPNGSPANVVPVIYPCTTSNWAAQNWTWISEPYVPPAQPRGHYIESTVTGAKCVSVPWSAPGLTFLLQYPCAPYPNQLWNAISI